ncbi:MAG: hypothetical protein AB7H80_08560 [Candidatus Kapaibacterium sp.]
MTKREPNKSTTNVQAIDWVFPAVVLVEQSCGSGTTTSSVRLEQVP